MTEEDFEQIQGTWAYELKQHFDGFTKSLWIDFNTVIDLMHSFGHENKIDKMKWREYVLWDMQRRHDLDKKNGLD